MAVNNVIRMLNLTRGLNTDGDVDADSLSDSFVSNTYISGTYVSNNFFQNTSTLRQGEVIEDYYVPCDGRQITTVAGTANTEAVTATQLISTTLTKVIGSEITGYQVPSGTKYVQYEFHCINGGGDNSPDGQYYMSYKIGSGSYNPVAFYGTGGNGLSKSSFIFEVGAASANVQLGQMTESTPKLDFKLEMRTRQTTQKVGFHPIHTTSVYGTGNPTYNLDTHATPYVRIKAFAGS